MNKTVSMRLPEDDDYRCCGCGKASLDKVKPCECVTMVGYREKEPRYVVFIEPEAARRLSLSETIKTRLLGVKPEDQDLVLEDYDWMRIIAALERG